MPAHAWAASLGLTIALGSIDRVSVDTVGGDPNSSSGRPAINRNGRFVAFDSLASDLVEGDGNGLMDVYVRDLERRTTTRVSVDKDGGDPDFDSYYATISANGRRVAFLSLASDLVDGDEFATPDVFVRDVRKGVTTRVSVNSSGGNPDDFSNNPDISANGRFVAFDSFASDLVDGDGNGMSDVFVRDLAAGTTVRASVDRFGGDPDNGSGHASISGNGRYVAFTSYASDLVPGDGNGIADVFVRDLQAGTTTRASVDMTGGDANGPSDSPHITADGRFVAFVSLASDLVPNDGNFCFSETGFLSCADVFVRDLVTGTTVRASVDAAGGDANNSSHDPSISPDGRLVAFVSDASDVVPNDGNGVDDVFVRDLATGTTIRASVDAAGSDPDFPSNHPALARRGRVVAFESFATDLIASDGNHTVDVYAARLHR